MSEPLGSLQNLPDKLKNMLLKIEKAPYHALPSVKVRPAEKPVVKNLAERGWVKLVPEDKRLPEHYTLTGDGSHAIDTFATARLASIVARFLAGR